MDTTDSFLCQSNYSGTVHSVLDVTFLKQQGTDAAFSLYPFSHEKEWHHYTARTKPHPLWVLGNFGAELGECDQRRILRWSFPVRTHQPLVLDTSRQGLVPTIPSSFNGVFGRPPLDIRAGRGQNKACPAFCDPPIMSSTLRELTNWLQAGGSARSVVALWRTGFWDPRRLPI